MKNKEAAALMRIIADAVEENNRVCPDDFKIINENDYFAKIKFALAVDRAEECVKAWPLLSAVMKLVCGEDEITFNSLKRCEKSLWLVKRNIRNGCSTEMKNGRAPWKDMTVEDCRKIADVLEWADRLKEFIAEIK